MATLVKELECRLENFTADIRKNFFNRERSLSLGRTSNDNDNNNCTTEKKPDKTETFKTQLASVALSALKVKDLNTGILSSSSATPSQVSSVINQQQQQQQQILPTPSETQTFREGKEGRRIPPNRLALAPPPIPKRTFQGKSYAERDYIGRHHHNTRPNGKIQSKSCSDADNRDCSNDLCSISFDDIGDSDDLVIFDKKLDPNQSSSDSSRSQTTIDTGYISAFETDRSSVTTSTTHQRQFRGRFSSEDTQSSLDSYLSSDLQRADTVESLQSNFTDSPFVLKKNSNIFNFEQTNRFMKKIASSGSIDSDNINNNNFATSTSTTSSTNNSKSITTPIKSHAAAALRRPTVPTRKGIRPPPLPPLRASQLADIMRDAEQCFSTMISGGNNSSNARASEGGTKPLPAMTQINHARINQRQDSNISSDSYSMMSSPSYSTKTMEAPLLRSASKMNKSKNHQQNSTDSFIMSSMNKSFQRSGGGSIYPKRQDSGISCESQNSSPGSKLLDAPLLAKMSSYKQCYKPNENEDIIKDADMDSSHSNAPIIKSASTPASLQTIVRFSNGSNMSHTILSRKNSHPYVTRGKLQFTLCQILLNAIALLIIGGGLAAYFRAYPTIKFVNTTITKPTLLNISDTMNVNPNPQPGICLPIIVKFCQNHKIPYNFTVFPNYIGHFGQLESQVELEQYDALVDVQCFELVPLYLCSLFVPKCSSSGKPVPPCRNLCLETMRRCGFFFDVFGLDLPEYLHCTLFTDSLDSEECVGGMEMKEWKTRKPTCDEFLCDKNRCIPEKYKCDGVVDCYDQTDELHCYPCNTTASKSTLIHCGDRKCMNDGHICDNLNTCPYGEDERNCIRLSSTNGDLGKGTLEVYRASKKRWELACFNNNQNLEHSSTICSLLGYRAVNGSRYYNHATNQTVNSDHYDVRSSQRKTTSSMPTYRQMTSCNATKTVLEVTCMNFECGKVRTNIRRMKKKRIVGGSESKPGDWPFLAAILGGPEEIFYCAGVLIADQWILTASHCIGNHTLQNLNEWTIQLGMTRRHSHAHYGQKIKVKKVIPHPQYSQYVVHDNDIALFQLATRVAFHDHLLPVCLPPARMKELAENTKCVVIGWGKKQSNSNGGTASAYETAINEVTVPILNRDTCNDWLGSNGLNVTDGMICAGYQEGKKDACQGDSGGPLLCPLPNDQNRWFVGGIVSWGIACAQPKLPGVYANVVKYIPWILSQMNATNGKYEGGGGG